MKTKSKEISPKFIQRNILNIILKKKKNHSICGREILNLLPSHCICFQKLYTYILRPLYCVLLSVLTSIARLSSVVYSKAIGIFRCFYLFIKCVRKKPSNNNDVVVVINKNVNSDGGRRVSPVTSQIQ